MAGNRREGIVQHIILVNYAIAMATGIPAGVAAAYGEWGWVCIFAAIGLIAACVLTRLNQSQLRR